MMRSPPLKESSWTCLRTQFRRILGSSPSIVLFLRVPLSVLPQATHLQMARISRSGTCPVVLFPRPRTRAINSGYCGDEIYQTPASMIGCKPRRPEGQGCAVSQKRRCIRKDLASRVSRSLKVLSSARLCITKTFTALHPNTSS